MLIYYVLWMLWNVQDSSVFVFLLFVLACVVLCEVYGVGFCVWLVARVSYVVGVVNCMVTSFFV